MNKAFPSYKSGTSTQGLRIQLQELHQENAALKAEIVKVKASSADGKLLQENARLRRRFEDLQKAVDEFLAEGKQIFEGN
jgi:predicted  nucleic acid-binding Zn-ribbon protein